MWVSALRLTDFRSYPQLELSLTPGVTTFVGQNGQGKTNLVEAIAYASILGSHRVAADAPLVRQDADRAIVGVEIQRDDRAVLVELEINPGKSNRARVNRSPVPRARDVLGILHAVVFAPEDLALVKGDPSDRRRFLDDLLIQRAPRMQGVKADYERVLKQRNTLLKSASSARRSSPDDVVRTLEVWDEQLATLGADLVAMRVALVDDLRPWLRDSYAAIAGGDEAVSSSDADLSYVTSLVKDGPLPLSRDEWRERLVDAMAQRRKEELDRGITLVGPHRDDVALSIGTLPAKGYASHGESWSLALGLRLASLEVLRADGGDPVLILDDVFAELDAPRRRRLSERVSDTTQVILTAAVGDDVPPELEGRRVLVTRGSVSDG